MGCLTGSQSEGMRRHDNVQSLKMFLPSYSNVFQFVSLYFLCSTWSKEFTTAGGSLHPVVLHWMKSESWRMQDMYDARFILFILPSDCEWGQTEPSFLPFSFTCTDPARGGGDFQLFAGSSGLWEGGKGSCPRKDCNPDRQRARMTHWLWKSACSQQTECKVSAYCNSKVAWMLQWLCLQCVAFFMLDWWTFSHIHLGCCCSFEIFDFILV